MSRWAFAWVLLCSGCVVPFSGALRAARDPVRFEASAGKARVIFMQAPNLLAFGQGPFLLDRARRQVIGHSVPNSYFSVELEPGSYELCPAPIWMDHMGRPRETAAQLEERVANLSLPMVPFTFEAGGTYLIEVSSGFRTIELSAVWPQVPGEQGLRDAVRELRAAEFEHVSMEVGTLTDPGTFDRWFSLCSVPPSAR